MHAYFLSQRVPEMQYMPVSCTARVHVNHMLTRSVRVMTAFGLQKELGSIITLACVINCKVQCACRA